MRGAFLYKKKVQLFLDRFIFLHLSHEKWATLTWFGVATNLDNNFFLAIEVTGFTSCKSFVLKDRHITWKKQLVAIFVHAKIWERETTCYTRLREGSIKSPVILLQICPAIMLLRCAHTSMKCAATVHTASNQNRSQVKGIGTIKIQAVLISHNNLFVICWTVNNSLARLYRVLVSRVSNQMSNLPKQTNTGQIASLHT